MIEIKEDKIKHKIGINNEKDNHMYRQGWYLNQ
jgi:hypothetical protein